MSDVMVFVYVKNVPDSAANHKYVVARWDELTRAFWYWGAFDSKEKADMVSNDIDGYVFDWTEVRRLSDGR